MPDSVNLTLTHVVDVARLVDVAPDSTVSRTVLKDEGCRVVLFGFDAGQELSEHTAAVPVLLQVLDGRLEVTAADRTVQVQPGDVLHLGTRTPHSVVAHEPSHLLLTMLDPRQA